MPDEVKTTDSADEDPQIKVTDRRMFTAEGELREEFQFLDQAEPGGEAAASPAPTDPAATDPAREQPVPVADSPPAPAAHEPAPPPAAGEAAPPRERRPDLPEFSGPASAGFLDLVAMLAESAAVYLGDVPLPDGSSGEQLEMARLHIDLLDVLRQKTAGNLTAQESGALEDVLYRLRVGYVQKRG